MQTLRYELGDDGIATLTFDEPGSPVNTMTLQWQADMAEAAAQLQRDRERVRGVLLQSAKSTFFAGAPRASQTTDSMPACRRASAVAGPAMPPPTTRAEVGRLMLGLLLRGSRPTAHASRSPGR